MFSPDQPKAESVASPLDIDRICLDPIFDQVSLPAVSQQGSATCSAASDKGYKIISEQGFDSDRIVFFAIDKDSKCYVIKKEEIRSGYSEFDIHKDLEQERIPKLTDSFDLNRRRYLVIEAIGSEVVDGFIHRAPSLAEVLARLDDLEVDDPRNGAIRRALTLEFPNICRAFSYLHEKNLVHRDCKPGNIVLNRGKAYLIDFGIAVPPHNSHKDSLIAGSLCYLSPEQVAEGGYIAPASDIRSLATVLYEVITGSALYSSDQMPPLITESIKREEPSEVAVFSDALPKQLADVCLKGLKLRAGDRYRTMIEFADAINQCFEAD